MCEANLSFPILVALVFFATALHACGGSGRPGTYSPDHSARYTGSKVQPATGAESEVLASIDGLTTGVPKKIGGLEVVADVPYFAASGRTCRRLVIRGSGRKDTLTRLACKDGTAWFYAPDVFAPERAR